MFTSLLCLLLVGCKDVVPASYFLGIIAFFFLFAAHQEILPAGFRYCFSLSSTPSHLPAPPFVFRRFSGCSLPAGGFIFLSFSSLMFGSFSSLTTYCLSLFCSLYLVFYSRYKYTNSINSLHL
jgi:hypothetical protein